MTARDEAIQAIRDADSSDRALGWPVGWIVDAIPGDVLVRLAIERGALKEYDPHDPAPLYQVVES